MNVVNMRANDLRKSDMGWMWQVHSTIGFTLKA